MHTCLQHQNSLQLANQPVFLTKDKRREATGGAGGSRSGHESGEGLPAEHHKVATNLSRERRFG